MTSEDKDKLERLLDVYFNARTAFRAEPDAALHDLMRGARADIVAFIDAIATPRVTP
jgi:hypothetical protein